MRQSIRGYTDAVIEEIQPEPSRTAEELAAVRDLIGQADDLRRALSDPGLQGASRRAILDDVFGGRLGDPAMRLLRFAVEADRAQDFVDDVSWLALRLDAAARDLVSIGEATLGRKAAEERLDGYATAVLEGQAAGRELTTVEDDMFRFLRALQGSDELRATLTSRDVPAEGRRRIVVDLLQNGAAPASVRLASYATRIGRPRDYESLLTFLVDRVALESNRRLAEVRSAVELDQAQQERLASVLARIIGREVDLRVSIDRNVLGGFVATVGDTVVDGSARHRLNLLRERLETPEPVLAGGPSGHTATTGEPTDG